MNNHFSVPHICVCPIRLTGFSLTLKYSLIITTRWLKSVMQSEFYERHEKVIGFEITIELLAIRTYRDCFFAEKSARH